MNLPYDGSSMALETRFPFCLFPRFKPFVVRRPFLMVLPFLPSDRWAVFLFFLSLSSYNLGLFSHFSNGAFRLTMSAPPSQSQSQASAPAPSTSQASAGSGSRTVTQTTGAVPKLILRQQVGSKCFGATQGS